MNCPNCGTYIYGAESENSEWYNSIYYDSMVGRCPKCGKCYSWTEVYILSNIEDVKEVQPDE